MGTWKKIVTDKSSSKWTKKFETPPRWVGYLILSGIGLVAMWFLPELLAGYLADGIASGWK